MGNTAKEVPDKRESTRNPVEIGIVCQPYSSTGSTRHCTGVLCNYSSGGVFIKTPWEFKTGTILVIRTIRSARPSSFHDYEEGLRTICLAEVKWHQDLSDHKTTCYGMGLCYLK